jgi:CheY-like chemotaxis protein
MFPQAVNDPTKRVCRAAGDPPRRGDRRHARTDAHGERDYVRRASALRADGYLVKPFQAAKLVDRIKALLAHRSS